MDEKLQILERDIAMQFGKACVCRMMGEINEYEKCIEKVFGLCEKTLEILHKGSEEVQEET